LRVKTLFFIPALVYTFIILYLSLINLADTSVKDLGMSDKVLHGGAYFGLGIIWMIYAIFGYNTNKILKSILIICISSTLFGIFIEVLQDRLTDYRQLDIFDVLANTAGVVVAGVTIYILRDYLIRLKAKINLVFMKK
jgi:VanZ family protein